MTSMMVLMQKISFKILKPVAQQLLAFLLLSHDRNLEFGTFKTVN